MGNYAVVIGGVVANLVVWDQSSPWRPPEGAFLVSALPEAGLGWRYDLDTNTFVAPAPPSESAPPSPGAQKLA